MRDRDATSVPEPGSWPKKIFDREKQVIRACHCRGRPRQATACQLGRVPFWQEPQPVFLRPLPGPEASLQQELGDSRWHSTPWLPPGASGKLWVRRGLERCRAWLHFPGGERFLPSASGCGGTSRYPPQAPDRGRPAGRPCGRHPRARWSPPPSACSGWQR